MIDSYSDEGIDYTERWGFASTATFTLQTGTTSKKVYSYGITPVKAETTLIYDGGKEKNFKDKDAIISMYPGKRAKGNPVQFEVYPQDDKMTSRDIWIYNNMTKGNVSGHWEGGYSSSGYLRKSDI